MKLIHRSVIFGLWMLLAFPAYPRGSFTIKDIRVEGLQRISAGTVFSYLPVQVGDQFDKKSSGDAIKALFKTGFFKDVRLEQDGSTLVVIVEERPSIASVKIEGNKDISTDDLTKALKGVGLTEGKVFDRQILDKVEQELRRQYYSRGKYGLKINSEVTDLERNRVSVLIKLSEGRVAKIKQINIVGNNAFPDPELLDAFELGTTNLLSFYTKNDQYSKQKLQADLERLKSYYMDRGYINFQIESTQVAITPDKKQIYINVNVKEGDIYKVSDVKLTGKLVAPPDELTPLVQIGPTDIFSRKLATETSKAISDRLGEDGYIFANVNMVPDIREADKSVAITFFVDPGKQVYVRRIGFTGNTKTRDEVLRREMRQMEAAWASSVKIERSKTRLERLGYFQEVNVETPAVPGTTDQIDVNYSVTEKPSGNIMAGVGYSQVQGIIFNASVTQDNVFGTGKRLTINFNNSNANTIYRFGYFNPYTTIDGISSGIDLTYRRTSAFQLNLANYSTDIFVVGGNVGIPLSEFSNLRFNLDYQHTKVRATRNSSQEVYNFLDRGETFLTASEQARVDESVRSRSFDYLTVAANWTHDTLNRAIFPTHGGAQRFTVLGSIPFGNLQYYKAGLKIQHYFPIAKDLTFMLEGEAAYGDGYGKTTELPFFEYYYAGGPQSVRGFLANTLGPKTTANNEGRGGRLPLGGSSKLAATAELLFPVPFLSESKNVRMGAFFDAGNVYYDAFSTEKKDNQSLGSFLRYSTGLSARWLSPFGALVFSVAQPLNAERGDRIQNFQFSFGSNF